MLPIMIFILKIIGIILLVVLGLILLVALTVLLVPIRYKGNGSCYGKPEGTVGVSWLLHILSVKVSYREKFELSVRLFGFRLFKEKGEEPAEDFTADFAKAAEEPMVSAQELTKPLVDPKEEVPVKEKAPAAEKPPVKEESPVKKEPPARAKTLAKKKKSLRERISERIRNFFKRVIDAFRRLGGKLRQAENFRESVATYINDEENKKTFRLVLKQGKKVILHILPTKMSGNVTFGLEDPYRMGQVLSGAALFYPVYHKQLSVQPVFDRQILEGELFFKGRIRAGTLLVACLRVLLNRNFRTQLKRFLNRGGA